MSPWPVPPARLQRPAAFTLVELLVVVLIIGILAAIALPRLLGQRTRAKNTAAQVAVRHALMAAKSYYTQNSESYAGLGATQLQGYESSLSGSEPGDSQAPGSSANPQDIWIGNGSSGNNPSAGDVNGGKTIVLCSASKGDAVYCAKDTDGSATYLQAVNLAIGIAASGNYFDSWSNISANSYTNFTYSSSGVTSCGLLLSGTARCWGANGNGELGDGTTSNSYVPVTNTAASGLAATVHTNSSTCVLFRQDGSVQCWGNNNYGQLGNGSTTNSTSPVNATGLSGATAIFAGTWNVCALLAGGTLKCWGYNGQGQMGDGTRTTPRWTPTAMTGISGVSNLTMGDSMMCALLTDVVRCWGDNYYGQLGLGDYNAVLTTTGANTVASGAAQVVAGGYFACALLIDGTVKCWGRNEYGQVGDGSANLTVASPTPVSGLLGVTRLSAGYHHTCALLVDGSIKCWGRNSSGQLGNTALGQGGQSGSPVQVSGVSGASSLFSTQSGTCARWSSGTVKCWGSAPANGQASSVATPATLPGT